MMWRIIFTVCVTASLLACSSTPYKEKIRTPLKKIPNPALVKPVQIWQHTVGNGVGKTQLQFTPAQFGPLVYAAAQDGTVLAIRADNGKLLWQQKLPTSVQASIGADANRVYVPSNDKLLALAASTGDTLWQSHDLRGISAAPQSNDQTIVIRSTGGGTTALDNSGKQLWRYNHKALPFSIYGAAAPRIVGNQVLIGTSHGEVISIEMSTGTPLWAEPISFPYGKTALERIVDVDAMPLVGHNGVYIVSMHGKLTKLNLSTGDTLWHTNYSSTQSPALVAGRIIASHENGMLTAFNDTGEKIWESTHLRGYDLLGPISQGRYIAVATRQDSLIFWFDALTGALLAKSQAGGKHIMSMTASPYGVLAYTTNGTVSLHRINP